MTSLRVSVGLAAASLGAAAWAQATPSLRELGALVREADAIALSGPTLEERLGFWRDRAGPLARQIQDDALIAQLNARKEALLALDEAGAALVAVDPSQCLAVEVRLGWAHLDMAAALRTSWVPTYLTEEQEPFYTQTLDEAAHTLALRAVDHAEAGLRLVRASPDLPDAGAVWSLWAAAIGDGIEPHELVCPAPLSTRQTEEEATLRRLTWMDGALREMVRVGEGCLPPDDQELATAVLEQSAGVITDQDASLAREMLPFLDDTSRQVAQDLTTSCGGRHVDLPPMPPAPAAPAQDPLTLPSYSSQAELDAALSLAAQLPLLAPPEGCRVPWRAAERDSRFVALALAEVGAAGLLADPATHDRAALALAVAFGASAHEAWLSPPKRGRLRSSWLAAASALASRADRLLLDLSDRPTLDPGLTTQVRAETDALHGWRALLASELLAAQRG